ncbi:hypothetical protein F5887DRAFT_289695 [Amanita rubescens]|nr:hypothetical protein F5887DRAFT_289695 [Amanita rubescens]
MPNFQTFCARIKIDNDDLPEYDVQIDENEKLVSCWIPSEAGKNFSVCCSITGPLSTDIEWRVLLDGFLAAGKLKRKSSKSKWNRSYCRISPTAVRDFSFSSITFTGLASPRLNSFPLYRSYLDDDAYLNTPVANFGEIKVEIWAVKIGTVKASKKRKRSKTNSYADPATTSNTKVHERSKKVGTHCIQFGGPKEIPHLSSEKYMDMRLDKLATFVFRYRPLAMLQANGIAPPAPRAAHAEQIDKPDSDVLELVSSDEDEMDRRVKKLKSELKQLESRRAKKMKVKVEKREDSPRLNNEVIDLT